MPYEKGHKYHPPKARRMNIRHLLKEVQEKISASTLVDFHLAVLQGKDPIVAVDSSGDPYIECKTRGAEEPNLEQRLASVDWLAVRGWGQPAQMHIIEQFNRQDGEQHRSDFSELQRSPAAIRALRAGLDEAIRLLRSPPAALDAGGADSGDSADSECQRAAESELNGEG